MFTLSFVSILTYLKIGFNIEKRIKCYRRCSKQQQQHLLDRACISMHTYLPTRVVLLYTLNIDEIINKVLTWNVWWFVSEYITIKPWPFFMYKSLIEANCSVPAVSNISNTQGELSTCNEISKKQKLAFSFYHLLIFYNKLISWGNIVIAMLTTHSIEWWCDFFLICYYRLYTLSSLRWLSSYCIHTEVAHNYGSEVVIHLSHFDAKCIFNIFVKVFMLHSTFLTITT